VVGGIGRVDYCAANAFLDSFALSRRKSGPLTISINWDAWQDVGMGAENSLALQKTLHQRAMSPQEGVEAFHRALSMGVPRVVVSVRDFKEISRSLGASKKPIPARTTPKEHQNRPQGTAAYVAPRNNTEEALAVIWQELLGITPIGIHDDFHALGGDSLLASQVVSRIRHTLDVDLPLRAFFEGSTIASLALAIVNLRAQQTNEKFLEDTLSQLEQLSDEDAEQGFSALRKGVTHA
jgi:acyl carrier protein